MSQTLTAEIARPGPSYLQGVVLVLMAVAFWSSMGLGVRMIEAANVWQILLYRSFSLSIFLFLLITFHSGYKPLKTIRRSGIAGISLSFIRVPRQFRSKLVIRLLG